MQKPNERPVDFSSVTDVGGEQGSRAQLARLEQRYAWALGFCAGKDVLEVACGTGPGLGMLARIARSVTGADIDPKNLARARMTYRDRPAVCLVRADAEALPFAGARFDVVLLFEALYYLPDPGAFVREARRVLRPDGTLLVCTANKDLPDFNPSPLSYRYYGARDLRALLEPLFSRVELFGGDLVDAVTLKGRALRLAKRSAVRLRLMPRTMKGKRLLKRVVFGSLVDIPGDIGEASSQYRPPVAIRCDRADSEHRVLYVLARPQA
jgi:ubiquinone/menaquinone biosynthesis C-methylase UbiE